MPAHKSTPGHGYDTARLVLGMPTCYVARMHIFQILLTAYTVSHIYVFICLRRAFGGGLWQLPALCLLACMALSWLFIWGRGPGAAKSYIDLVIYVWMGFLLFLLMALFCCDALALLSRLLAQVLPFAFFKKASAWLVAAHYVPIAVALACLLFVNGIFEAHTPKVRQITITTGKLPPSSPPIRIVGVTDVHIVGFIGPVFLESMVATINSLAPDIVVSCGDLVDTNMKGREKEAAVLRKIKAPLGKFAVSGNHEVYRGLKMSLDFMEKSGFRVLRGETAQVGGITLAGVDDRALARSSPATTDTLAVLNKAPGKRFTLLLNHQPVWRKQAIGRFDLQYSGHTHAGQIWPGSVVVKRRFGVAQGLTTLRNGNTSSLLYVSNGTGYWGPPVRFFAPSEITLIILKPER